MAFLVRMLRVLALLLEPFVPNIAARLNYLLGIEKNENLYPELKNLENYMIKCMNKSKGLRDPIPLVSESNNILKQ